MKLQEIIENMPIIRHFERLEPPKINGKCECGYEGEFKYTHSEKNENKAYSSFYICPNCKGKFKAETLFKNKNDRR